MNKLKWLLPTILSCVVALFIACNKDAVSDYGPEVEIMFAGRVTNESGDPISDARVESGDESAQTDQNGIFKLKPVRGRARNAILHIRKNGYFNFSRAFVVQDQSVTNVQVQLLEKDPPHSLNAASGAQLQLGSGMSLSFPANALVRENGAAFSGFARVYAKPLAADDPDLGRKMPGDLRAIDGAGEEGVLSTFGMVAVELEDNSGNTLKVAAGKSVTINMAIPSALASVAPEEIPLWYFDEESARWKEEGKATKVNGAYVGEVSHFSFWNCDAFSETVYMDGSVFFDNRSTPLIGAEIQLTVLSNGFKGSAISNGQGWFGGAVPKGYEMLLEIRLPEQCGGAVLYSQNIGPFETDVTLSDIIINDPSIPHSIVEAQLVDCDGQPVENGYAILKYNGITAAVFASSDGSIEYTLINCQNVVDASLTGYDLDEFLESTPVSFILDNTNNLGNITVCNTLSEYIQYTIDGQSFTKVEPNGNANGTFASIASSFDSITLNQNIYMWFVQNPSSGSTLVEQLNVNGLELDVSKPFNVTVNVDQPGLNVGDSMTGTFGGDFKTANGTSHTITGSYKVLRDW
ncbi:MAG: hypothetical protein JNJ57_19505 [Saprospiraceae bacterium]|nr:hypothetical protein [Saprospiraceae bacterium]